MQWRNTSVGYGSVAKFLHWSIVILIIAQYVIIEAADELPDGPEKLAGIANHKSVGMLILGLALVTVAALHALAALYHHFVRKDDTLRRMLPFVRPRGS